ncbi:nonsense-mediated mRNA decay factor SMG5-like [Mya arenaria]|uniref:nonsense-mediated mRNA decay factor SMG5-like n=1 Tax=Mya arenaria TaxID=6604 RepID=UPI0022E6FCC4|nr:nonsense-mediated mRNA decay factor SMG5-like [Mya arenaria]
MMEHKSDLEKAKKVYRAAVDAVKKLDESLKKKKAYREVFSQDAVGLRYKLREYCERLMFYNPLYYGRKAEEVLWRKVFYDIIQLIKRNRRHVRVGSSLETAYRTHLSAACGYYYHLLFRLQKDFNLKLNMKIDFPLLPDNNPSRYIKAVRKKEVTTAMKEWALKTVHRCLVCLGDIARYQHDFDAGMNIVAERFYLQAWIIFPEMGVAHNQLGTLASSRYFYCEAAYHYIRCLSSEVPFEGAEGNLLRLFEKNQKRYQELTADTARTSQNPHEQCYNDLKAFFIQFMNLLKIFYRYDVPASQQDNHEIQECCQATLNSFNQCMFYEPTTYSADLAEENLHFLEDDVVFKIVVMCTSTIHILQNRGSRKVTAATAFLLALFSHILNHVVIRLQGALYERENPNKILQANTHNYDGINGEDSESDSKCSLVSSASSSLKNGHIKHPTAMKNNNNNTQKDQPKTKKLHTRMRRRRRPKASKVDSDSDLSDMSDLSEGEAAMREEISDDSEEEPLGFYNDDSDSELSDSLMKSQDLEPGFAAGPGADSVPPPGAPDDMFPIPEITAPNHKPTENLAPGFGAPSSDTNKMWPLSHSDSLATFSSELFSSSVPFLSSNFKLSQPTEGVDNDVIMGKKQVSVPPGFHTSSEAKHVAEISQKLANFVIETDTEASITATEIDSDGEEDTPQSSEDTEKARSSSEEEREGARVQHVLEVIQGEGLMPAVKVITDWMTCNSAIIMTCAQSSQSVWCRLSVLLNFLPHESTITEHAECWSDDVRVGVVGGGEGGWSQTLPLPEDIHLTRFPPLSHAHKDLPRKTSVKMSEQQESFLRTRCLRQFGHFLSGLKGLNFSYNEEKGIFIGPAPPISTEETQEDAMEKMVDAESRRNQLMRDMAQLRLQAEVSQLEGNLSQPETAPFPPYVIPDATSLCTALPNVRRLAQSNRTIIVIPLAVIDSLDIQKKESHGAREAIRWLEAEFRKGNRYIRAQKNSEKLQTAVPKHLKKKNRDTWCALEIFNCALYLSRQGGDFGADTVIAVLTATKFSHLTHPLVKQTIASSEQEGVSVENVTEFMAKWSEDLNKR